MASDGDGRLGCLDSIECYITDQCGAPRICGLPNLASVQFNRILDDVSQATVTIPVSSGVSTTKPCCDCLDVIEPWCHELHIVRNGVEVWVGPIVKITYQYTQVVIEARDVVAWTQVRIPVGFLDNTTSTTKVGAGSNGVSVSTFTGNDTTLFVEDASKFSTATNGGTLVITHTSTVGTTVTTTKTTLTYKAVSGNSFTGVKVVSAVTTTVTNGVTSASTTSTTPTNTLSTGDVITGPSDGQEITDIALDVLQTAFADYDPCVLDYVVQTDLDDRPTVVAHTKVSTQNGFAAFEGTVWDWLETLSENGLDYTTLGRSIILSVQDVNTGIIGVLTDEFILGEIELAKDGFGMVTRAYVRYEQDTDGTICAKQNPTIPVAPCPALSEAADLRTDPSDTAAICYGPIERIFDDAAPFDYTTAKQTADLYISYGSVAPRTVDFSSGSQLSQDTPWEFNDMIPGQKVLVSLDQLCLDVFQYFKILEVVYSLEQGGDEVITVSLGQLNAIGNQL